MTLRIVQWELSARMARARIIVFPRQTPVVLKAEFALRRRAVFAAMHVPVIPIHLQVMNTSHFQHVKMLREMTQPIVRLPSALMRAPEIFAL